MKIRVTYMKGDRLDVDVDHPEAAIKALSSGEDYIEANRAVFIKAADIKSITPGPDLGISSVSVGRR